MVADCSTQVGRLGGDGCSECSDYRGGCLRWLRWLRWLPRSRLQLSWVVTPYQGLSYPTNSTFALLQESPQSFQGQGSGCPMSYDGGRLRVLYEMGLPKDGSNVLWVETCLGTNGRSTRATNLRLCLCCNPHHHHQLIPNKTFQKCTLGFCGKLHDPPPLYLWVSFFFSSSLSLRLYDAMQRQLLLIT